MAGINRLSQARVRAIKRKGMYPDGGGLYLRVANGVRGPTKSWLFRYAIGGRERYCGLGALHTIGLAEAREQAKECRRIILDGGDPISARKARRSAQRIAAATAKTFEECAAAYIADHAPTWRSAKSGAQWRGSLTADVYPIIGKLLVRDIGTAEILRVLEPIWQVKPETASRIRGRIEAILAWAAVRGYRSSENPARWKGHLKEALPSRAKLAPVKHLPALPYDEVATFVAAVRKDKSIAARALEFLILTACRTAEVLGATWAEIDLDAATWTIPALRTKANREHRVPLPPRAVAILTELQPLEASLLFPGGQSLQRKLARDAMLDVIAGLGRKGEITAHGFRAAFRTWVAERTNFPREVGEAALAHINGDRVEASYQRGSLFDKRRRLMNAWSEFCSGHDTLRLRAVS